MSFQRITTIIILMLALSGQAQAIINIEDMQSQPTTPGFNGKLGLSVKGASGNSDKIGGTLSGRLQWDMTESDTTTDSTNIEPDTTTDSATTIDSINFIIFERAYGKSNDLRDTNRAFVHGRHINIINDRHAVETFAQMEKDEFARLLLRSLAGGGWRFDLSQTDKHRFTLGLGLFLEREELREDSTINEDTTNERLRLNSYLSVFHRLNEQISLASTIYFQPDVENKDDFRASENAAINIALAESLSLKLSVTIRHNNQPPRAVERTDVNYQTGIEYRF